MKKGYIVLENGMVFEGERFGAKKDVIGELVFTTGVEGYIETLTDPCHYGQIILQTFPLIGNYGWIDADTDAIRGEGETNLSSATTELFEAVGGEQKIKVECDRFSDASVPAILKISEESRRFSEMMKMYAPDQADLPTEEVLVLNASNPIIDGIENGKYGALSSDVAKYVYYLSVVARGGMSESEITEFFKIAYSIADHIKE